MEKKYIYIKSFVTADSSARKSEVAPIVSASDRDPFASDLGPSNSFLARSPRGSRSPASAGPIPARTLSGPCADAVHVDPELGGSCGGASVLLVAGEDLCGAIVARRRCLGPIIASREIFVVPEIFVVLDFDSRIPLSLLDPHCLAFFGPCLPARSDCWLLELG